MAKLQDKLMNRTIEGKLSDVSYEELPSDIAKESDIPTNAQITNLAKTAIQADKDVLSQLVFSYDEDNNVTTITFPKYVLPLSHYNDELGFAMFFDYFHRTVLNSSGEEVENSRIDISNNKVVITIFEHLFATEYDSLTYINFNNTEAQLNTYNLYHSVTEAGTKLYRHILNLTFKLQGNTSFACGNNGRIILYVPFEEPITNLNIFAAIISSTTIQKYYEDSDQLICRNVALSGTSSEKQLMILDATVSGNINAYAFDDIEVIGTDNVTKL